MARLPAVRNLDGPAATRLVEDLLERFPFYTNIAAAGPEGRLFASALPARVQTTIADREYFQRVIETRECALSGFLVGRATGKPVITLACPSLDDSGALPAVVLAGLDLAGLGHLAAAAQLPEGSVIHIADPEGVLIGRHPAAPVGDGAMPVAPTARAMPERRDEGTVAAVGPDGVSRFFGCTPLTVASRAGRIHVAVGIPAAASLAGVQRDVLWHLGVLLVVTALALVATRVVGERLVARPLRHLLDAVKRVGEGDLTARAGLDRGRVALEVADTGPGIPPEIQARLFEPFFTTKPAGQGTGPGLPMCQGIVEGHGGTISVRSDIGRGAVFTVELPVEAPCWRRSPRRRPPSGQGRRDPPWWWTTSPRWRPCGPTCSQPTATTWRPPRTPPGPGGASRSTGSTSS